MKIANKITIGFLALVLILNASCKKFLDDVSADPNNPYDVPINTLLGPIETALGYTVGGDLAQYPAIMMQEVTGAVNQQAGYELYQWNTDDFGSTWSNFYVNILENLRILQTKADQNHDTYYSGISRILSAYSLSVLVDCWNDVPDADALVGIANINPHYDKGQDVYTDALARLDSGIIYMQSSSGGLQVPGTDDILYGGQQSAWIKFAHSLKARLLLHESNVDPSVLQNILTEAGSGFTSNSDDAQVPFGTDQNNSNPMFQFNQQRAGNITFGAGFLQDTLKKITSSADQRLTVYTSSFISVFLGTSASVWLMTYHELEFIKAEAQLRLGMNDSLDLRKGIIADMLKVKIDTTVTFVQNGKLHAYLIYWSQNAGLTQSQKLYRVMFQKYLTGYLQVETWSDWRRTGIPFLAPKDGNAIPRRFLYPTAELQSNPNTPQGVTLLAPTIWWD